MEAKATESEQSLPRKVLRSRIGLPVLAGLLALAVGYSAGASGRRAAVQDVEELTQQLDTTHLEVRLFRAASYLSNAVVAATYGSFADARSSSAAFFDSLGAIEVSDDRHAAFASILDRRDDIQSLLAQREPIARDQLADVLTTYQGVLTGESVRFEIPTGLPDSAAGTQ